MKLEYSQSKVGGEIKDRGRPTQDYKNNQQAINKNKEEPRKKKMVGPMFWLIIMIAIFKDVSDVLANLTVVIAIFTFITSMFISFFITVYLYFEGVKFDTRKIAVLVINFIIGSIPLISFIPTYTASIFLIKWMENSKTVSKVTGQIAKKI